MYIAFLKRVFDFLFALIGLVLTFPIMIIVAIIIKVGSPGPVFYPAPRVARGGKVFKMIKFRSMVTDADKVGPLVTAGNDPRITPIGRFLRKSKLDELPSLWNVLIGQMSFVGPRPENPTDAGKYNDEQQRVLSVKPGITSLATIKYRHEEEILAKATDLDAAYFQIMQDKLAIELDYINNQSFGSDVKIIFQTLREILR